MTYNIVFTKKARKDLEKIINSPFKKQVYNLLATLENNPYKPSFEKLVGKLEGAYSRRINVQHRLVYKIDEKNHTVVIIAMWSHYGE